MRIVGLDLSLTGTGVSNGTTTALIASKGKATDGLAERHDRLSYLATRVCDLVAFQMGAGLVVIEQPAYSKQAGHAHDRSGLWWLVLSELYSEGIPVAEVAPSTVKKYATGKGNANKGAMIDATVRRFPDLDTGSGDDNRCDAQWLAAMGHDHCGQPLIEMPALNRQALQAVRWPIRPSTIVGAA